MEDHCKEPCAIGDEGHCERTEYEYMIHCEKRWHANKQQRGKITGLGDGQTLEYGPREEEDGKET